MQSPILLRWIGGKSKIAPTLKAYAPVTYSRYWEPFLGGAAMFFLLGPKQAVLSDINADLINCYRAVRDHPTALSRLLEEHRSCHSKTYYYKVRTDYNLGGNQIEQAARFIYLNKTCFNGIYRVNTNGEFNVPYGKKKKPNIPDESELKAASALLKHADLRCTSYSGILDTPDLGGGDFCYLDPPYPPLNGTSNFTHYTQERFSREDQRKVAAFADSLSKKNCKVMITNADLPLIRELYDGWRLIPLPVMRWVSANGKRYRVNELVIVNYNRKEEHHHECG